MRTPLDNALPDDRASARFALRAHCRQDACAPSTGARILCRVATGSYRQAVAVTIITVSLRRERGSRRPASRLHQTAESIVGVTAILFVIQVVENLRQLARALAAGTRVIVRQIQQRCRTTRHGLIVEQAGLGVVVVALVDLISACAHIQRGRLTGRVVNDAGS